MFGGFRSTGTQRGREDGIEDSRGTIQRMWSERRGESKKSNSKKEAKWEK